MKAIKLMCLCCTHWTYEPVNSSATSRCQICGSRDLHAEGIVDVARNPHERQVRMSSIEIEYEVLNSPIRSAKVSMSSKNRHVRHSVSKDGTLLTACTPLGSVRGYPMEITGKLTKVQMREFGEALVRMAAER